MLVPCALVLSGCSQNDPAPSTPSAPLISGALPDSGILIDDALLPPPPPELIVAAVNHTLVFNWSVDASISGNTQRLFQYDRASRTENVLLDQLAPDARAARLPVNVTRLPWRDTQYRVEICANSSDANTCVSSRYVDISELPEQFVRQLTNPEAPVPDPEFGNALAGNRSGNVLVTATPRNSQLFIWFRQASGWVHASTISLPAAAEQLALSDSGDVIVALLGAANADQAPDIVVLDRLGENWFATEQLTPASDLQPEDRTTLPGNLENILQLANHGDALLLKPAGYRAALRYERIDSGWSLSQRVAPLDEQSSVISAAGSADLDQLALLVHTATGDMHLERWAIDNAMVSLLGTKQIPILPTADARVFSDRSGNQLAVAGWESSSTTQQRAIYRQYDPVGTDWSLTDSLAADDTVSVDSVPVLLASTDGDLQNLLLGHRSGNPLEIDTTVFLYHRNTDDVTNTASWRHSLAVSDLLPANLPASELRFGRLSNSGERLWLSARTETEGVVLSFD